MTDGAPLCKFHASFDYAQQGDGELSFRKNDIILIFNKTDDWWYGKLNNDIGWVPPSFGVEVSLDFKLNDPYMSGGADTRETATEYPEQDEDSIEEVLENPYESLPVAERLRCRGNIIDEFIQTESEFNTRMNELLSDFILPFEIRDTEFKRRFLDDPNVAVGLAGVKDVITCCAEFMSSVSSWSAYSRSNVIPLVEAFDHFAPSMKLFAQLIVENTELLEAIQKYSSGLNTWFLARPLPHGTLEEYLILPIKHYPVYFENFRKIAWSTPPSSPEYALITAVSTTVHTYKRGIDATLKQAAVKMQLIALQTKFMGKVDLYRPYRRLIREGEVTRIIINPNQTVDQKSMYLHLLTDALVISVKFGSSFKLQQAVDLRSAQIRDQLDSMQLKFAFVVSVGGNKEWTFQTFNAALKTEWSRSIARRIEETRKLASAVSAVQRESVMPGQHATGAIGGGGADIGQIRLWERSYSQRITLTKGATAASATLSTIRQFSGGPRSKTMGPRMRIMTSMLQLECQFIDNLVSMEEAFIRPLMEVSKGASLDDSAAEQSQLFQQSGSAISVLGGAFSKVKNQMQKQAVLAAEVQIFLRCALEMSTAMQELQLALQTRIVENDWSENSRVGDIFLACTPLYKQFEAYAGSFAASKRLLRASYALSGFLRSAEDRLAPIPLDDAIDMPVGTPDRLLNLVSELCNTTPPAHVDNDNLNRVRQKLTEVAASVREIIKVKNNFEKLLSIRESLVTVFSDPVIESLVNAERGFVKEGDLLKMCRKSNKKFRFWLFSDCLIYGAGLPGGNYQFHHHFPLKTCRVQEKSSAVWSKDNEVFGEAAFAFEVVNPDKSFIALANNAEERDEWINAIQNEIQKCGRSREDEQLLKSATSSAPLWMPDKEAANCSICGKPFSLMFRRHHCRRCGRVCCDDCSQSRRVLTSIDSRKKQRVCDICERGGDVDKSLLMSLGATPAVTSSPRSNYDDDSSGQGNGDYSSSANRLGAYSDPVRGADATSQAKSAVPTLIKRNSGNVVAIPPPANLSSASIPTFNQAKPPPPPIRQQDSQSQISSQGKSTPPPPPRSGNPFEASQPTTPPLPARNANPFDANKSVTPPQPAVDSSRPMLMTKMSVMSLKNMGDQKPQPAIQPHELSSSAASTSVPSLPPRPNGWSSTTTSPDITVQTQPSAQAVSSPNRPPPPPPKARPMPDMSQASSTAVQQENRPRPPPPGRAGQDNMLSTLATAMASRRTALVSVRLNGQEDEDDEFDD